MMWRSLINALDHEGHEVVFFEKDVAYYRSHRDLMKLPGRSTLRLYPSWQEIEREARLIADSCARAVVPSPNTRGRVAQPSCSR